MDNNSIRKNVKSLWLKLGHRRRMQFYTLIIIMVISAFTEILSLGSVIPFLSVMVDSDKFLRSEYGQLIFSFFGHPSPQRLTLILASVFGFFAVLSSAIRLILLWINAKVSYGAASDIATKIFETTLYQPYNVHMKTNSSLIISAISEKVNEIAFGVLQSIPQMVSAVLILLAIIFTLLIIDPIPTLSVVASFLFIYISINLLFKRRLTIHSEKISSEKSIIIKKIQEGLASIRDVILAGSQQIYCANYLKSEIPLRKAQGENLFISMCPRYIVEGISMVIIAVSAYLLSNRDGGLDTALPLIGVLVLGMQRMLPVFQQIYSSLVSVQSSQASLVVILKLLERPVTINSNAIELRPVKFESSIELRDVDFSYNASKPYIFNKLSFRIKKGDRVGVVGHSGSGKSTFVDLLMGLLTPSNGTLFIDGKEIKEGSLRAWQAKISHVPQDLFVIDDTIAANIAFGVSAKSIDMERVRWAANMARIDAFINSTELGYLTVLGERGVSISGGQRQRIGIARALYKRAEVIILDEATSALDESTEGDVMASILGLTEELTIIMVTHRLSSLRYCNLAIKVTNNGIEEYPIGK